MLPDNNVGDDSVGAVDTETQLVQIFENIKAVLAEAGGDFSNVVKSTSISPIALRCRSIATCAGDTSATTKRRPQPA